MAFWPACELSLLLINFLLWIETLEMWWCNHYRQVHAPCLIWMPETRRCQWPGKQAKAWRGWAVERFTIFLNTFLSVHSCPWPPPASRSGEWTRLLAKVGEEEGAGSAVEAWQAALGCSGLVEGAGCTAQGATLTPRVSNPHTARPGCQGHAPLSSHSPPAPKHWTGLSLTVMVVSWCSPSVCHLLSWQSVGVDHLLP